MAYAFLSLAFTAAFSASLGFVAGNVAGIEMPAVEDALDGLVARATGAAPREGSSRPPAMEDTPPSRMTPVEASARQFLKGFEEPRYRIRLDAPDRAVRSWWAVRDADQAFWAENCRLNQLLRDTRAGRVHAQLGTEDLVQRMAHTDPCLPNELRRRIDQVKLESATRAIVRATLWHRKIPPYASEVDAAVARRGTRVRYELESSGDGKWRVADVLRLQEGTERSPEKWHKAYLGADTPFFVGEVYTP